MMSPILVFVASVLGSPHCAAMCGGFVAIAGQSSSSAKSQGCYHLGRLLTYLLLGLLAGGVGATIDDLGLRLGVTNTAAILTGVLLLVSGVAMLLGHSTGLSAYFPAETLHRIRSQFMPSPSRTLLFPFSLGLVSTLLPCGWLYSYVAVAAATASAPAAALVMLFFWLGTLPILLTVGSFSTLLTTPLKRFVPTVISLLMIGAGIFSLGSHLGAQATTGQDSHEHCAM